MSRWASFAALAVAALVLFALGWMIPARLRATDAAVLARAGNETQSLAEHGRLLVDTARLGPARLLFEAGQSRRVPGLESLGELIRNSAVQSGLWTWGEPDPRFAAAFKLDPAGAQSPRLFTDLVLRSGNREKLLEFIAHSPLPAVRELRELWNILYGTPPLIHANRQSWAAGKKEFAEIYRRVCPVARAVGYAEMTDHCFLTPNRSVQQTVFSNGVTVTVNFGDKPFAINNDVQVVPSGFHVEGADR